MSFLLDTCVLSESTRSLPDPSVIEWLSRMPDERKFVSVLSLGEIEYGILRSPPQRRLKLRRWYDDVLRPLFAGRTHSFDERAASTWAELRAANRTLPVLDSQIAATALVHGLTLVTRNVRDFRYPGLAVFNPWSK